MNNTPGYKKLAVKHDADATGIARTPYLDCLCGFRVSLPVIAHMPMTYLCICGREFDAEGWILHTPTMADALRWLVEPETPQA